jgi:hypothetical protein
MPALDIDNPLKGLEKQETGMYIRWGTPNDAIELV